MPMKGFFTQGVAVLFERSVTLGELEPLLKNFTIARRIESGENWEFGGPSFVIEFRPEVNGYVTVDVVDRNWPDGMGDATREAKLFAAWSMGHFGPFAWPGSLERACQHSYLWEEGATRAARHRSFVRIRTSYVLGGREDAPVAPRDCDPAAELNFVCRIVLALLQHSAALCYFNPNGELLSNAKVMEAMAKHYRKVHSPPVDMWTNRRIFTFDDGWSLMDTIGMSQLNLPDIEVCMRSDTFDPNDVGPFLVNTALYLAEAGAVIEDGHTVDGPHEVLFRAKRFKEGLLAPSRETLRFRPEDGSTPPKRFGFPEGAAKRGWRFWK